MNEIIQELTRKGKYDEWVSHGSYFGKTGKSTREYKYYDMNGDIINVSSVSKTYTDFNIPVFKQYVVYDPTFVKQATYKIVSTSEELTTSGLATCCGLAIIGDKKFLAHLDTTIDNEIPKLDDYHAYYETLAIKLTLYDRKMVRVLRNTFQTAKATIYAGNLYSYLSVKKAKLICSMAGITDITVIDVHMFDLIRI